MHKSQIKNFAVWARNTLLKQVADRAALFGITAKGIEAPDNETQDSITFHEVLYDQQTKQQYNQLVKHLKELARGYNSHKEAYGKLIDEVAYTWFNRLSALRFMEVKGYIPRVLSSSTEGSVDPDILRDAVSRVSQGELKLSLDLIDRLRVQNKTGELYNHLIVAQCNALSKSLPFLFQHTSEALALLLPHNLLHQESIVRRMVNEIPEADWQEVEIVGWLYQYYISERKDQVIGKTVATKDIPAATQLFTPNWIVKYMVQNSLGKMWMEAHPESSLKDKMEFYLPTPEQEPEVQAKIQASINPHLSPEELTVIDPACGSGHILTYAFELLFEIYLERGYAERDIPELILTKNLYGLDIDERAAQLSSFAVLMKAREKNRRILREGRTPELNVLTIKHTRGLGAELQVAAPEIYADWEPLIKAFREADTLGSLITPPALDLEKLKAQLQQLTDDHSILTVEMIPELQHLLQTAELLKQQYAVVVANPPYMGSKGLNPTLKKFFTQEYKDYKSDLFAVSVVRYQELCKASGHLGFMTPFVWMFIKSYENFRNQLLTDASFTSLIQPEYHAIFELAYVPICSFTLRNLHSNEKGEFIKLTDFTGAENQPIKTLEAIQNPDCGYRYQASSLDFEKIPGSPIAYWASNSLTSNFTSKDLLSSISSFKRGLATGDNCRFLRVWHEISINNLESKWFKYNKGGNFRRWFGNLEYVINWFNSGAEILNFVDKNGKLKSRPQNTEYNFWPIITYSSLTSSLISTRMFMGNMINDQAGNFLPSKNIDFLKALCSFTNSVVCQQYLTAINPTLNILVDDLNRLPFIFNDSYQKQNSQFDDCIDISKTDWDNFETSWDFQTHPLTRYNTPSLPEAFTQWQSESEQNFKELQRLEEENNTYWIEAYGLQDELTPEVPDDQITIRKADLDRDSRSFMSYAVGCIMGRYSLDEPGLIHAGQAFDPERHTTVPAVADAILPINDEGYFENDLASRFFEFVKAVYGPEHQRENLDFIADALERKKNESSEDRIRRYFLTEFVKDHNQVYKKRPIYWLFTSGKKRAFNAFVYLHRYSPDTLSKLRTDYLHELQSRLEAHLEQASEEELKATSATDKKKASKRAKLLREQIAELKPYDEKLRHLADQRIRLDLDDGVAYNYTLFEGLVYEGSDLKMVDLKKKSQWKRDLLAEQSSEPILAGSQ